MAGPTRQWASDVGEKLSAPHPDGGYDQVSGAGFGQRMYRRNGLLHRLDGPAIVWQDGTELWYRDGKLHRDGGPAVTGGPKGDEHWTDGKRTDAAHMSVRSAEGTEEA